MNVNMQKNWKAHFLRFVNDSYGKGQGCYNRLLSFNFFPYGNKICKKKCLHGPHYQQYHLENKGAGKIALNSMNNPHKTTNKKTTHVRPNMTNIFLVTLGKDVKSLSKTAITGLLDIASFRTCLQMLTFCTITFFVTSYAFCREKQHFCSAKKKCQ